MTPQWVSDDDNGDGDLGDDMGAVRNGWRRGSIFLW
jgi:hypothetical protein